VSLEAPISVWPGVVNAITGIQRPILQSVWYNYGRDSETRCQTARFTPAIQAVDMQVNKMSDIYAQFGITPGINARGNQTLLGGSTPPPEVQQAMDEATNAGFVDFEELLRKTGEFIADTLGTEMAFVTSGAAAAISLGSAAALAGDDRDKIGAIPDTSGFDRNEFVFQKGHDYTYRRCFTLSGAKLVDVGRDNGCTVEEMEAGIGPKTAAIAYFESGHWGTEWVSLDEAREVADRHGIKLVVDAAGQMYPLERFTRVARIGDVVAFGAKYFGSPHSTGICTGRADMVESAFQQNFLGFELAGLKGLKRPFGRPYKTDRGEVVGVAVALRRWFTMDHEERLAIEDSKRDAISAGLAGIPGVETSIPSEPLIGPNVVVQVFIDSAITGKTTHEVIDELAAGDPPIWTRGDDKSINIGVQVLTDEQVQTVIDRLRSALT